MANLRANVNVDGDRTFLAVMAALFVASATATIVWSASMSTTATASAAMSMPMPGGWTMSMAWQPMCGQTWTGVAATFVGMWSVMTTAMMLPSLMPMLWRYRQAWRRASAASRDKYSGHLAGLTAIAATGYFVVWIALGGVAFVTGAALTGLAMRFAMVSRGVPFAVGIVMLAAGASQFSGWKARRLACCRHAPICAAFPSADADSAWRHGVRLGLHCCHCCAGFTAILLVSGVMDWRAMAAVTLAISAERLLPRGERAARASGAVVVGLGLLSIAQAAAQAAGLT